ncbi:hypothetical protein WDZ92_11590 [Nostoc sp. NIES-2111]
MGILPIENECLNSLHQPFRAKPEYWISEVVLARSWNPSKDILWFILTLILVVFLQSQRKLYAPTQQASPFAVLHSL